MGIMNQPKRKFLRRLGLSGHVKPAIGGQLKPGHRDSTLISPYSPSSTQVNRHEVLALRFQSLSSVTFEGCLHSVARTSQARLVVPPEPFDAICCKRIFRLLLQLPTRDQVLTAFVYIQNDRQHRRPSVHFHPPGLLLPFTVFPPLCLGPIRKTSAVVAVSSPSVLLAPPRSAGGEPPWPDPQRGRGGTGG